MNQPAAYSVIFYGLLIFLPLIVLVSLAIVPWVTDRRECFGVSVPPAAHGDHRVRRYKIWFSLALALFGVACVAISSLLSLTYGYAAGFWAIIVSVFALLAVGFALQQIFRQGVIAIKQSSHWIVGSERRAAMLAEGDIPGPVSVVWNVLYVAPILASIVLGYANYATMPTRVAMHENVAGVIDGWANKSHGLLWMAPGVQLLLALVFTGAHLAIMISKRPVDPDKPVESSYAYGLFTRVWSIYIVVLGLGLVSTMGLMLQATVVGAVGIDVFGAAVLAVAVLAVVGAIVLGVFYGQNGSRVFDHDESSQSASSDDDRFWKLGILYFNRDDPAAIVSKRFGVGWTFNFARPVIWLAIVVLLAIAVGVPMLSSLG